MLLSRTNIGTVFARSQAMVLQTLVQQHRYGPLKVGTTHWRRIECGASRSFTFATSWLCQQPYIDQVLANKLCLKQSPDTAPVESIK